jgi:hypothetical protein
VGDNNDQYKYEVKVEGDTLIVTTRSNIGGPHTIEIERGSLEGYKAFLKQQGFWDVEDYEIKRVKYAPFQRDLHGNILNPASNPMESTVIVDQPWAGKDPNKPFVQYMKKGARLLHMQDSLKNLQKVQDKANRRVKIYGMARDTLAIENEIKGYEQDAKLVKFAAQEAAGKAAEGLKIVKIVEKAVVRKRGVEFLVQKGVDSGMSEFSKVPDTSKTELILDQLRDLSHIADFSEFQRFFGSLPATNFQDCVRSIADDEYTFVTGLERQIRWAAIRAGYSSSESYARVITMCWIFWNNLRYEIDIILKSNIFQNEIAVLKNEVQMLEMELKKMGQGGIPKFGPHPSPV